MKDRTGKALKGGVDYNVSYPKGMKNVGKYTVKVTFKENYSGSKSMTYSINPKGTGVSKVTAVKKGFKVTWKKQKTQTTGYQVQYSTDKKEGRGIRLDDLDLKPVTEEPTPPAPEQPNIEVVDKNVVLTFLETIVNLIVSFINKLKGEK